MAVDKAVWSMTILEYEERASTPISAQVASSQHKHQSLFWQVPWCSEGTVVVTRLYQQLSTAETTCQLKVLVDTLGSHFIHGEGLGWEGASSTLV